MRGIPRSLCSALGLGSYPIVPRACLGARVRLGYPAWVPPWVRGRRWIILSTETDALFCEDVPVADIAAAAGTPVYIYSAATLAAPLPRVCRGVRRAEAHDLLLDQVAGQRARAGTAGGRGQRVRRGLRRRGGPRRRGGRRHEQGRLRRRGQDRPRDRRGHRRRASACSTSSPRRSSRTSPAWPPRPASRSRAALRVNPDVYDPKTHSYTTTGKKETKFGVDIERAERFFETYGRDAHVAPGRHPPAHRLADLLGGALRRGDRQGAGADRPPAPTRASTVRHAGHRRRVRGRLRGRAARPGAPTTPRRSFRC